MILTMRVSQYRNHIRPSLLAPYDLRPLPLWRQGVLRFGLIAAQLFPRGPLNPIGGPRVGSVDACSGALHGRDKRSGRRSRWRARAGGARATAYGVVELGCEQLRLMYAGRWSWQILGHKRR